MSKRTQKEIQDALTELREYIESPHTPRLTTRIAYEVEHAIRWATENTTGWPSPLDSAKGAAALIKQDDRS